jgi:predicted N-acetyltransferase YhbS
MTEIPENITFSISKDVNSSDIRDLYKSIDWKEKDDDIISKYLERSLVIVTARDNDLLVGIARATVSQVGEITIWDVAVRPEYQKMGVGSKIMKCILTILDDYAIPVVTLYAESGKESFYEKFGFVPHKTRTFAMIRRLK